MTEDLSLTAMKYPRTRALHAPPSAPLGVKVS